jgi:hypothetical protein
MTIESRPRNQDFRSIKFMFMLSEAGVARTLRCCDAAAAINVVCHAKRWCSAVDLSAIRQA